MARRWQRSRIFEACPCAGSTTRAIASDLIAFNSHHLRSNRSTIRKGTIGEAHSRDRLRNPYRKSNKQTTKGLFAKYNHASGQRCVSGERAEISRSTVATSTRSLSSSPCIPSQMRARTSDDALWPPLRAPDFHRDPRWWATSSIYGIQGKALVRFGGVAQPLPRATRRPVGVSGGGRGLERAGQIIWLS
jgi:hypothetical protein